MDLSARDTQGDISRQKFDLPVEGATIDRTSFTKYDIIRDIWTHLNLPTQALDSVSLKGRDHLLPSSYRIADLSQSTIALSALSAALVHRATNSNDDNGPPRIPNVSVDRIHSVLEFASERLYSIHGQPLESGWGPISGLYEAKNGWVRIHDGFVNLRHAILEILDLAKGATREDVGKKVKEWKAEELEERAAAGAAVAYRLRTYEEWDASPMGRAVPDCPVSIRQLSARGNAAKRSPTLTSTTRCLTGLKILDLSRVIAAPVAGRTLAAHGAEVMRITSPNLPSIPAVDKDVNRGKKSVHLDLNDSNDLAKLEGLVREADVFIQAYRPGSLAARGLTPERLVELNPGIIIANLSAWGNEGPWKNNRGFDSIVQTVSGLNASEASHFGTSPAKPLPVQALDHAAGYFLATGICAALYHQRIEGGSWEVHVSLAATGKYVRSLGQIPGQGGWEDGVKSPEEWLEELRGQSREREILEEKMSGFGMMTAVRHAGRVDGMDIGFERMPKEPGSDEAKWD